MRMMNMLFRQICCILLVLAAHTASAQRLGCVHGLPQTRSDNVHILPEPFNFDPQRVYRQPVVLVTFSDVNFSMGNPVAYYNRLLNEKGYNDGVGPGCLADYIRDQSGGRANIQFDIYGPVQVSEKAGGHQREYMGRPIISEALKKLCETVKTDFSIYDWDDDGEVDQVILVAASYSGNNKTGYIWPNTGWVSDTLPGDIECRIASISSELWPDNAMYGIGTIAHEYFHCLGLPDIYPQAPAQGYSTVDEWDLMDGGNYTNYGWCPPNLSAMEKMYLGWGSPTELTESTSIENMRPVNDGGETFIIRNPDNKDEFYLLENRQQEGWDYGCPGKGLLIFHVNYSQNNWWNNNVNSVDSRYNYHLFHASGKDYRAWDSKNNGSDPNRWTMKDKLRSSYLSTSPYPYTDPTTLAVNDSLTDNSDPASILYRANTDGREFMGKAITGIRQQDDGSISFNFMRPETVAVTDLAADGEPAVTGWYDLNGRRLSSTPRRPGLYIVLYSDGTKKYCRH